MTDELVVDELADDLDRILARVEPSLEELRGGRLFLTGGTGFFGRWMLASLIRANRRLGLGAEAVVLTRNPGLFATAFPAIARAPGIALLAGDVRDFAWPEGRFTHVIHAATDTSPAAAAAPRRLFDSIVGGTARVLELAVASGAGKLLLTSSGAVYGTQPLGVARLAEGHSGAPDPADPGAAYGSGKRAAEHLCALAWAEHGIETKIARCFAFVGPHLPLNAQFAVGNFIRDALERDVVTVNGDGTPVRSYLYAGDLAGWLWTILAKGRPNTPYNVGSDEGLPLAEVARRVVGVIAPGKPVDIRGAAEAGPRPAYVPDVGRARGLGLDVWTPLDDAIFRTALWARAHPPAPADSPAS